MRKSKGIITASIVAILLAVSLSACKAPVHPGSANSFDSAAFDTLHTAQAVIEASKLLAQTQPEKDVLNKVIAAYNTTLDAYTAYHQIAVTGAQIDTSYLASQLTLLLADVANLKAAFPGKL